jgi:hypothetical protein
MTKHRGTPAFLTSSRDHAVIDPREGGNRWIIKGKLFIPPVGDKPEFRIYSVNGDINDLEGLKRAIIALLEEHDVTDCTVTVQL